MHAALLTLAAVIAAPVPKEKPRVLYFPTTVGAEMVFVKTNVVRKSEYLTTVAKVEVKDGAYEVTVKNSFDRAADDGERYTVTADAVASLFPDRLGKLPPVTWLKVTAKPGDTWECPFDFDGGTEAKSFTRGGEEEVEVPAGKFKAIRVDSSWGTAKFRQKFRTTVWVASEVGVVKTVSDSGGKPTEITVELKSFTPGKGEAKAEPKPDK